MLEDIYKEIEDKMASRIDGLQRELSRMRTGRATPSLLDGVRVDYYNTPTPLNQIATVSVPEARLIVIQPWEKSIISNIEKAIASADLGLNPNNDGNVIRIPIPPLNQERRQELAKQIKKHTEEAKVSIRNIRRDYNESVKKRQKDKLITEDDMHKGLDHIQKITDKVIDKIEDIYKVKEKEILEV